MAIGADNNHDSVTATFTGLPKDIRYNFAQWNLTTYGNIVFTFGLFLARYSVSDSFQCRFLFDT